MPNVWVGNHGEYTIPNDILDGVVLTKSGYPDKRYVQSYQRFMEWVKEQEDKNDKRMVNELGEISNV